MSKGARALIPESAFEGSAKEGTTYVAPQIVVDVDHSMKIMSEETFGPVMGVMKVSVEREEYEKTESCTERRARTGQK